MRFFMVVELGNRNRKLEISTVPKKRSRGNPLSQAQAVSLFQFTLFRVFCSQCKTLFPDCLSTRGWVSQWTYLLYIDSIIGMLNEIWFYKQNSNLFVVVVVVI